MDIKNTLKALKLNEQTISMVLGALVVLAVGLLAINFLRGRAPTGLPTEGPATTEQQVALPAKHTVTKGEHLWVIAERYYESGYNWVDIAKASNLQNADVLLEGQELAIPDVPKRESTVQQQDGFGPPIEGNSYTIEKGDHLWGISVRAYGDGFQWVRVAEANSLSNPNIILPGQTLNIPR